MAPTNRVLVKSYFFPEEKDQAKKAAEKINLPLSEYVRRVTTGTRLPQPGNAEAIRDLCKVNADLARLGNLFKMALDEEKTLDLIALIDEIKTTQNILKSKIKAL